MYILHLEHILICSSIFLGLSSGIWVLATVMDNTGLEIQMNGFVIIDKYLLEAILHQALHWACSQGINQTHTKR